MEVEKTNFVTHLIITVHIIDYVKIWSNKFQMVMIVSCVQVYRKI